MTMELPKPVAEPGAAAKLRVAQCAGFYFPDTVGGTEVYVRDLAQALGIEGVESSVIAATDRRHEEYQWENTTVLRYPTTWAQLREYSSNAPRAGLSKFQDLVVRAAPDVFHLHSWTSGAGLQHLSQVAQLGIPCIVTLHVASALCLRGTMLLFGERACDGLIGERRCTQCWAISRGLPRPLAVALSHLPRMSVTGSQASRISRRAATVLSGRSLVAAQARDLQEMASLCDRIVAPSQWVASALVANAVPPHKIVVSRQAVAQSFVERAASGGRVDDARNLRIGFVGRLEPYKGPHILLEAMAAIPRDVPIRLLVAGSGTEPPYLRTLEALAKGDDRIEFLGPISHGDLPEFLEQVDVLAVPSAIMETGPLVVVEANAFGVPVMGADLGGVAERIRDGIDGWLLPFNDSAAWAAAMLETALDRTQLERRRANARVTRTMNDVASEMAALYRQVLAARSADMTGAGARAGVGGGAGE